MLIRTVIGRFSLVVLAAAMAAPATARVQDKRDQARSSRWSALLDVDLMVNTYSRFLARKYDLNEEQDEFTRQYLADQAHQFMDANRDEVTDLIDRMFEVRTGGEMDSEELIDWGKRIVPIYQDAKKIIVMGNGEWRDILTDEQKAIHDSDLKMMHESFETTEDQLERIVTGQMSVEEFRKPRNARRAARRPRQTVKAQPREPREPPRDFNEREIVDRGRPDRSGLRGTQQNFDPEEAEAMDRERQANLDALAAEEAARDRARAEEEEMAREPIERPATRSPKRTSPTRTTRKKTSTKSSKSGGANFESTWEAYTRKFIEKYKLDDGQTQKANSILRDCQEQGRRHMAKNKSRFESIEKKLGALKSADKKQRAAKMLTLNEQQKKLRQPIDRIFEDQLKPRLDKLPTRSQRKAAESGSKSSRRKGKKNDR